ncbi:BnaAnng15000D [Brassica napus]|uniref:BnaAnng15000D protein n=1 Tax=Brassica napus TaxID=3708 RepID=A0A078J381_BRANA|nr:BnaAnng15000D [Brassica napus]
MDDPQVRCTPKTVGTRHVGKKTLPRRRSGSGKEVTKVEVSRKNPPSSERESGHQNDDDHAKENESDNARFPPSGGNKGDQQQETQSNALVPFGDVLDVEPESYVLPAEHAVTSPGACSVGSVRSFHPSWDGNPSSKSKERSAPEGGEGHQKWVGAPPVGYESGQTSNQNDGEGLEQVSAPMGFVEALVKEINSENPGADEEIRATRGGEGAQPKENESVAARMTPTAGIDFAQKTGADNGGESGQTSNQNDGERLEQVSAPMGFVEALVKEINSEIPGADEVVIS